jgi:hypothetical protein
LELCRIKGQWKRRENFELHKLYNKPDLATFIKINRLKWTGHVIKMDNNRSTDRMFDTWPEGRGIGMPKLRWGNSGEWNWKHLALYRKSGKNF